jgi:hypothetical protein
MRAICNFLFALGVGVLFVCNAAGAGSSSSTDPDFRGMHWGDASSHLGKSRIVVPTTRAGVECRRRIGERLLVGNAQLESITYCFYKDRFFGASMNFKGQSNYAALLDAVTAIYGRPTTDAAHPGSLFLSKGFGGGQEDGILTYDDHTLEGELLLQDMVTFEEVKAADRASERGAPRHDLLDAPPAR